MLDPRVYRCMNWSFQLCTICALSCSGTGQVTTGTLLGTVHDAANAALQGTSVTITNLETGVSRSVLSGNEGEYILNLLPVGNYSVRVEHTEFRTEEHPSIELRINSHVRLDFVMQVGSVSEKVDVKESAPFANYAGRPLWQETILARQLKPAAARAGIGKIGWHTFRHTYSTMLRSAGTDIKVQQELLRHANIQTTMNI